MILDKIVSGVIAEPYPDYFIVLAYSEILRSGNIGLMSINDGRTSLNYIYNKYEKVFNLRFLAPEDKYHLSDAELLAFFAENTDIENFADDLYFYNLAILEWNVNSAAYCGTEED